MPHSTAWRCLYLSLSKTGRRSPGLPFLLPVRDLVFLLRDGAADAAAAQVAAVGEGAVRLVGQNPARARAGPAASGAGDAYFLEYGDELRAVAPLAGGDNDGQGILASLDGEVELAGQPAAGAAESVVAGLGAPGAAGLLLLRGRVLAGARAVPESTETSQVTCPAASARACSAVTTAAQVPSSCQLRNRP
jgi:hypothetical protein